MGKYGLPYMGSKSGIADELIRIFPKAENFYDLFGGGFSITHAMLVRRSRDFKQFHFNEIRPGICELIKKAIDGEYNYNVFRPEWVSREEFFAKKELDPYIKMCWSFGNNGQGYLFGSDIEPYKKSMHNAIVFNEFDELAKKTLGMEKFREGYSITARRSLLRNKIEHYRLTEIPDFLKIFIPQKKLNASEPQLQQLQRLQRLQQLEQLQQLQQLERLEFYNVSYEDVPIKDNSIIYCDIPYQGAPEYDCEFDHKAFFDWASDQRNPVFISEYSIDDCRFKQVFQIAKRSMLSSNKNKCIDKKEKVFANEAGIRALKIK